MATREERVKRVEGGSRRRRDLAAIGGLVEQTNRHRDLTAASAAAQAEREHRLRPKIRDDADATTGWPYVLDALFGAVPPSTFGLWLAPLDCIGVVDDALAVTAPEGLFAWVLRRYGALLGGAVREATDFRGAFLFLAAPMEDRRDGLL